MTLVYLVRFGGKLDSGRVVATENDAYDLIVDVIKNRKQIHHPSQGAGIVRSAAQRGDVLIIEFEIGSTKKPRKILGGTKAWFKEMEARGCTVSSEGWKVGLV